MATTLQDKLAAIATRSTLYEAALVNTTTGERRLLCYSAKTGAALRRYVWRKGAELVTFCGSERADAVAGNKRAIRIGQWQADFTGRTQREAIIGGELAWFGAEVK
jgi:hypothetical protein